MKEITLPANGIGMAIMALLIALIAGVPFIVTLWLVSQFAPTWVAIVAAFVATIAVMRLTIKRRQ